MMPKTLIQCFDEYLNEAVKDNPKIAKACYSQMNEDELKDIINGDFATQLELDHPIAYYSLLNDWMDTFEDDEIIEDENY